MSGVIHESPVWFLLNKGAFDKQIHIDIKKQCHPERSEGSYTPSVSFADSSLNEGALGKILRFRSE